MKSETAHAFQSVFLVRGGQALLVERFVRDISKQFLGEPGDSKVSVFYADETPVADVIGSACNLSMFSSKKVVVLRRAETLDKQSLEAVKQYAAAPPPHARFVLVSGDLSKPDLKSAEGIFVKDIREDSKTVHKRVIEEAESLGLVMERDAAICLCDLVGEDLNVIRSELTKLAGMLGSGARLSRKDISQMLDRRKSRDIFELTNAIMDGEKTEALVILGEIAAQNQIDPLFALSAVSARMRNALRAAAVRKKSEGASPERQKKQIAKELKIKPGAAHFLWKQSRNFAHRDTARIMKTLADTDRALKTSRLNGYEALVRMTVSLLGKR